MLWYCNDKLCLKLRGDRGLQDFIQFFYLRKLLGPSRNKRARILFTLVVKQCCDDLQGNIDVLSVEFR